MRSLNATLHHAIAVLAAVSAAGCSSEITQSLTQGPVDISGSYDGIATGIDGGRSFDQVLVQFTFFQTDTLLSGDFEINSGSGTLTGYLHRGADALTIDLEMTQANPCPGEFTAAGEVRQGTTVGGGVTLGIVGQYEGTYCDGDVTADYFVQLRR